MSFQSRNRFNYFTAENSYPSGASDLTVVREEVLATGLIVPNGIALFERETTSDSEGVLSGPNWLIVPTPEETQHITATRSDKGVEVPADEGENHLEIVKDMDALYDTLVGFVSQAIRTKSNIAITLNPAITSEERECIESVSAAVQQLHTDEVELNRVNTPSDNRTDGYGMYL